jgi:predicted nucleic acid-binding protein
VSELNIVDSSGWLEYLADSKSAAFFASAIEDTAHLLVPVITVYEVFKKILRERGENEALQVASMMQGGRVIELDSALALDAARYLLPLADSLIYATALRYGATLWTQDEHFKDLPRVKYWAKKVTTAK